jgi:hypothetical protein
MDKPSEPIHALSPPLLTGPPGSAHPPLDLVARRWIWPPAAGIRPHAVESGRTLPDPTYGRWISPPAAARSWIWPPATGIRPHAAGSGRSLPDPAYTHWISPPAAASVTSGDPAP